jgi:hypothetical protein
MNKLFILLTVTTGLINFNSPPSVKTDNSPCDEITINTQGDKMTIANLTAAHTHVDVYKIKGDGGWVSLFSCNDNCGKEATVAVEAQKKYLVHVKMFDVNWNKICEKQIEQTTTGDATETGETPSCNNVTVTANENTLTVANVKAPHSHVDIYKVRGDGGWDAVFSCNDNCQETITTAADVKQKYIIHVKYFTEGWAVICDKQIAFNPE